jgi:2-oxoglutarate dehydrogenase E2 component (dihydrolipoamide succinyltransferase)
MIEVKIPTVGESITEVTLGRWTKNNGDRVSKNEIICELESDKASFELTAEVDGILSIKAEAGQTVPIGAVIATIEEAAVASSPAQSVPAPVAQTPLASPKIIEMIVPTVGESITEVTVGSWNKKDGDLVKKDEVLCELESDKASFDLIAESGGILRIIAPSGSTVPIGGLLCKIEQSQSSENLTSAPSPAATTAATPSSSSVAGHPSPAAAKILAEKGIESSSVSGSGVGGRITKEDALKAQAQKAVPQADIQPVALAPQSTTDKPSRRQKMTNLRKTIAKRLVAVKNETAMLTTFNEVDMKAIMDLRSKYKDAFKEKFGIGLGFMSFFTKAVCIALQEWPAVNAYIDGDEIVYNDFCDISVAVSTPRGLVTPVVRQAQNMSLDQIEKEIAALALKARDNKLSIPEMTGGTFTITNGGVFGSMLSTPILNPPQSAILGMHNIVNRPVAIGNVVEIRPIMYVALSYDHRIIDGRESVSFLVRVKQLLEDPSRLILGV